MQLHSPALRASAIIGVIIVASSGWALFFWTNSSLLCAKYVYISEDAACNSTPVIDKTNYNAPRNEIVAYIEKRKEAGEITSASFYFRDLEDGPTTGYDEYAQFAPASLLKLPLAFVFLTTADEEPAILNKPIRYRGDAEVDMQRIRPRESALPETDYSIRELLRMMISHSDNASYRALEFFIINNPSRIELRERVFQELGLVDPTDRTEGTLSVRGYASLFRILYDSVYLSPRYSEELLSWLAASDYNEGLVAGVPVGIEVAHKFGERLLPDGQKQMHDCGIVYFPDNPYLLCVMTRGDDWAALEETISTISRMLYNEVDQRRILNL